MSSTKPVAEPADAFLQPNDGVAISFWIISIAMIAATVFFFAEAATVRNHWKTSLHVGGSIYPLGYFFGYLLGAVDEVYLNVIYNIADFVNKIAFVLACWSCAKADTAKEALLG